MECEQVKEYLSSYMDGCLSDKLKEQVEAHLEDCSACKAELEAYVQLSTQLCAARITNTDDFKLDMKKVKAPVQISPFKKWIPHVSAVAACLVLIVGVAVGVNFGTKPTNPDQTALGSLLDAQPQIASDTSGEAQNFGIYNAKTAPKQEDFATDKTRILNDDSFQDSYNAASENGVVTYKSSVVPEHTTGEEAVTPEVDTDKASAGGSFAEQTYEKHIIQLMIIAQARDAAEAYIQSVRLTTFASETVLTDAALADLLSMDGVYVQTDTVEETTMDIYAGNTVIIY